MRVLKAKLRILQAGARKIGIAARSLLCLVDFARRGFGLG